MATEQLTKPSPEQEISDTPIGMAISRVAEFRGLLLEPQRLSGLVAQVEYRRNLESMGGLSKVQFEDNFNDVRVRKPELVEGFSDSASKVDFTPVLDDEDDDNWIDGAASATPDYATGIALKGIRGMQNYVLLVDAGLLEQPDILYGETNPAMAITAEKRLGMLSDIARRHSESKAAHEEMRDQKTLTISGTFEEVSARLFSPETRRFEKLLMRRQAMAKSMGHGAVIGS